MTLSRTAIYLRISQDRTGEALAIERQRPDCMELADGPVTEYSDNDLSASSGKPRPDYERLMKNIRAGKHTSLIVWAVDRLYRNAREAQDLIEYGKTHPMVVKTSVSGNFDLGTPMGRKQFANAVNDAVYEIEQKSVRQKSSFAQSAGKGAKPGGRRLFGYKRGIPELVDGKIKRRYETDAVEAAAILDAYKRKVAGATDYSIYTDWNARGIRTTMGNEWTGRSFRELMSNPALAAQRYYKGILVSTEGKWPPILTIEEHRDLVSIFADPKRRTTPGPTPKHLLGGIARCHCGSPMKSTTVAGNPGYRCLVNRAGHVSIKGEELEEAARSALVNTLWEQRNAPPRVSAEDTVTIAAMRAERSRLEAELEGVFDLAGESARLRAIAKKRAASIEKAIDQFDKDIEALETQATTAKIMDAEFKATLAGLLAGPRVQKRNRDSINQILLRRMVDGGMSQEEAIGKMEIRNRFGKMELGAKRDLIRRLLSITVLPMSAGERVVIDPA